MRNTSSTACLIGLLACSHGSPPPVDPASPSPARRASFTLPPGVIGPHGTLLLGDLHGTREIPSFVGEVVTALAARAPVVLALEIIADQVPSLDAFLASDGGAAARAAALRDPWWHDRYQDGRRSVAMLDLLDTARRLRASGARIDVVCFDAAARDAREPDGREQAMARNLLAARAAHPDAALVAYAGNLHTRRAAFAAMPAEVWMAMRLAAAGVTFVTLDPRYAPGSAWICQGPTPDDCGPRLVDGAAEASGIHLEASSDGGYDGWFGVGAVSASPPAGLPEAAAGLDARLAALRAERASPDSAPARRARALAAYNAKQYRACADEYAKISPPTSGDAYNQACCLTLAGDRDAAFDRLRAAIDLGFTDLGAMTTDADLAALHGDPRWPPAAKR
jgi:hypothetical protein